MWANGIVLGPPRLVEYLDLQSRTPRYRVACRTRVDRRQADRINDCWALDLVPDELFNGQPRAACLHQQCLLSLEDSVESIKTWRIDYNELRLCSDLEALPVETYALELRLAQIMVARD